MISILVAVEMRLVEIVAENEAARKIRVAAGQLTQNMKLFGSNCIGGDQNERRKAIPLKFQAFHSTILPCY